MTASGRIALWNQNSHTTVLLGRVSIASIKHHDLKLFREEKIFFHITLPSSTPLLRRVGQKSMNKEAVTEVETMRKQGLMSCFSWFAQPAFSYNPEQPAMGWHHPHLCLSYQSLIMKVS